MVKAPTLFALFLSLGFLASAEELVLEVEAQGRPVVKVVEEDNPEPNLLEVLSRESADPFAIVKALPVDPFLMARADAIVVEQGSQRDDDVLTLVDLGLKGDFGDLYGEAVVSFEDDGIEREWRLDRATVGVLFDDRMTLVAGKNYLPTVAADIDWVFESEVYQLTEAVETSVGLGYDLGAFRVLAYAYRGDAQEDTSRINGLLGMVFEPCKGFGARITYNSDLLESDVFETVLQGDDHDPLPSLGFNASVHLGRLSLIAEVVSGLDQVDPMELALGTETKPQAWSLASRLDFSDTLEGAIRLQGAEEFLNHPEFSMSAQAGWNFYKNLQLSVEIMQAQFDLGPNEKRFGSRISFEI